MLIVEEDEAPPDGTVVVALLDDEQVTVKRLYREGEMVKLNPQNGDHEDIIFLAEQVQIQDKVVHVIHPPAR